MPDGFLLLIYVLRSVVVQDVCYEDVPLFIN
jgi:hypothetical protein